MSYKKLNVKDPKKRDFLVKQLKKQREEEYYQRQAQLQEQEEREAYEAENPTVNYGAQRIILVKDSYLHRDLASYNNTRVNVGTLPTKWSKKKFEQEQEEMEDEDEDDEVEDEEEDEDEYEDDEDVSVPKGNLHDKKSSTAHLDDESTDDDEDEYKYTTKRVVQIIEDFNEVQVIDNKQTTTTESLDDAKTVATAKQQRAASRSPRHGAIKTPTGTPSLAPLTSPEAPVGDKSPYHAPNTKKERELLQQMDDLDLNTIGKNISDEEKVPLPDEHDLDATNWWKYILSRGSRITKDGKLFISVIQHFPLAAQVQLPEEYFHLSPGRRSTPDKPLTAFGLFKRHAFDQDPSLAKKAKGKAKHAVEVELKQQYFALNDEELDDYSVLALCEKLRYKVQRAEHIFQASTSIVHGNNSHSVGKKHH